MIVWNNFTVIPYSITSCYSYIFSLGPIKSGFSKDVQFHLLLLLLVLDDREEITEQKQMFFCLLKIAV